jgi:hypothetical protein
MKVSDWNDPRLRRIGEGFAAEAYDLASDLQNYGADASVLLLPKLQQRKLTATRRQEVCIPTSFADALMALLLSLPRPGWASKGTRNVGINIGTLSSQAGRRRTWSPSAVEDLVNRGWSKRAAAKEEAGRTGTPVTTIERGMQVWRSKKNQPKKRPPQKR